MAVKRQKQTQATEQAVIPAVYLRVSTDEQADSGLGLAAQLARANGLLAMKGWSIAAEHIYRDEGISGTLDIDKRVALKRLMSDVKAGIVHAVIVLDLSRLARNTQLVLRLIGEIEDAGAEFISIKEGFDTSTATGKFVLTMFAALGQLERDLTSERTVAALDERGKQYGYKAGKVLYGYTRNAETEAIEIDEQAAEIVRRVYSLKGQGKTLRAIGAELGKTHSTIQTMLSYEATYRGKVAHWPAILDRNVCTACHFRFDGTCNGHAINSDGFVPSQGYYCEAEKPTA